MEKEALTLSLITLVLIILAITSQVPAQSIEVPIKKITDKAEQYEIGNINYAQLTVYIASLKQELAEEMGASSQENEHNVALKAEQLEKVLGTPTETTKWVWVEREDREVKLNNEAPAWRKLIFDGKKIQIWFDAWPHLLPRQDKELLFYRLHLDVRFKKPEEQLNIDQRINEIKVLAEEYSINPDQANLETLAEKSINVEQLFNEHFNQNPGKCEEVMNSFFGTENKRDDRQLLQQEITIYEGDDFEVRGNLEMCDDCEWNWINFHFWIDRRGPGPEVEEESLQPPSEQFSNYDHTDFEREIKKIIGELQDLVSRKEFSQAIALNGKIQSLNDAWNQESNDVWKEVEQLYSHDRQFSSDKEERAFHEDYGWIKVEQEKRKKERELRKANYEKRKQFYLDLFSSYDKREFSFTQKEWEKRLVEEFRELGKEICDNNIDDNNNEQIDCQESQCGGKICGYDITAVEEKNLTRERKTELYCITLSCQMKEEVVEDEKPVCGNNICEPGEREELVLQFVEGGEDENDSQTEEESESSEGSEKDTLEENEINEHEEESLFCPQDCAQCPMYNPLECSGSVIFSGEDEKGCPLEPICLSEDLSCEADEDCQDPLCGDASCVNNVCQIIALTQCTEPECADGSEKIQHCASGENFIIERCVNGIWKESGIECEIVSEIQPEEIEEEIVGEECTIKNDCGNENDVCSNGHCVTLPEVIETDENIPQQHSEEEQREIEKEIEIDKGYNEAPEKATQEETPDQPKDIQEPEFEAEPAQEPVIAREAVLTFFKNRMLNFIELQDNTGSDIENTEGDGAEGSNTNNENEPQQNTENNEGQDQDEPTEDERDYQEDFSGEDEREDFDEKDDHGNREQKEKVRRNDECKRECEEFCYNKEIRPCTEECIWEKCGNELECDVDEVRIECGNKCKSEKNLEGCETECADRCLAGENIWNDFKEKEEEHKEEKFVFTIGGSCRTSQGRGKTEGFIWFGGWGENFNDFHRVKNRYYIRGGNDWCEEDLENLIKQREELEKSLNEEFASWFFEKYVANSASDWEKHISGIFELYWRDVDISRQIAERLQCLRKNELPPHTLVNFKYGTDYGSVEFWEEIKTTKIHPEGEEIEIISPYMKTWLFPSREFFKAEMRRSMERHQIPGQHDEETRKTPSPSEEQKQRLIENGILEDIRNFNDNFGENLIIQFKDFDKDEVLFNIYARINNEELMHVEPMLPSENPAEDVRVELDVEKLLDIVEYQEEGRIELESPPWDKRPREGGFVERAAGGVRMFFMFQSLMNSAKVYPESAQKEARFFVRNFFEIVMGNGDDREDEFDQGFEGREGPGGCQNEEECKEYCEDPVNRKECIRFRDNQEFPENFKDKEFLTGEVIRA